MRYLRASRRKVGMLPHLDETRWVSSSHVLRYGGLTKLEANEKKGGSILESELQSPSSLGFGKRMPPSLQTDDVSILDCGPGSERWACIKVI